MILQLYVKISDRYSELKFELRLAKPRWNFIPGWKFQIFHIIDIFSNPGTNIWYYAHANSLFIFLKIKMTTLEARFEWRFTSLQSRKMFKRIQSFIEFHGMRNTHCSQVKFSFLIHFSPVPHFYTPWKLQKTKGFLMFSGGIEIRHWAKMG